MSKNKTLLTFLVLRSSLQSWESEWIWYLDLRLKVGQKWFWKKQTCCNFNNRSSYNLKYSQLGLLDGLHEITGMYSFTIFLMPTFRSFSLSPDNRLGETCTSKPKKRTLGWIRKKALAWWEVLRKKQPTQKNKNLSFRRFEGPKQLCHHPKPT